jgi:hypothetical protein
MWCRGWDTTPAEVVGFSHPVERFDWVGDIVCGWSAAGEASCFQAKDDAIAKATRVPALDGALDVDAVAFAAAVIAVITKDGRLAYGSPLDADDLGAFALTRVPGGASLRHLSLRLGERTSFADPLITHVTARDDGGRAYAMRFEYDKPITGLTRSPQHDVRAPGAAATGADARCRVNAEREFVCRHPLASMTGAADDVVVMRNVASAASSGDAYCAVDAKGQCSCLGRIDDLLGKGPGIQASSEPLTIGLR